MNQIKSYEEVEGKTIKTIRIFGSYINLIFQDNTFAILSTSIDKEIFIDTEDWNLFLNYQEAYQLGIISEKEMQDLEERDLKRYEEEESKREYEFYLKLKTKYEK